MEEPGGDGSDNSAGAHSKQQRRSGRLPEKNLAMFHCETWRAQRVQQSSAVKSSLRLGDQRAAAFTHDRQNVLSLNKSEKAGEGRGGEGRGSLAEHNVCS